MADFQRDQVDHAGRPRRFPRYRAVATDVLPSPNCEALRPGEGYYKLTVIDNLLFSIFATADRARAVRSPPTRTSSTIWCRTSPHDLDHQRRQDLPIRSMSACRYRLYTMLFGAIEAPLGS